MDWMYTDRIAMAADEKTAEEYLLGKPINKIEDV